MGMTELIFVTFNGQYYRDVLLSQQMLLAIKPAASDYVSFNKSTLHLIMPRTPLNSYSKKRRISLVLISHHQTTQT